MALNALLKFTQGALIGVDGQSLVVAGGAPVTVGNSTGATDVGSWTIELLYAPPGSALFTLVPVMEAAGGATAPLWVFSPDVGIYGLYRIRLTVYSGPGYTGSKDVDIRNVGVVTPNRKFLVFSPQIDPPPLPLTGIGAKPHEFNFNGQPFGWAGDNEPTARGLNEALLLLDTLTSFAGVPYNYYTVALTGQTEFILPEVPANGVILLVVNGLVQKPEDYSIVANIVKYLGIPLSGGAGVSVYYWLDGGGGGGGTDLDAVHVNVANEIAVVTEKVTPVGTDVLLIEDSEDLNLKKRIPLSSLSASTAYSVIDASLSSGANNDVNPTGWAGASAVRLSSPAAAEITGFAAVLSTDVLQRKLYNVGSYNITLKHQNTGSAVGNRFIIPGGGDLVMAPNDVVDIFDDLTTVRWRVG